MGINRVLGCSGAPVLGFVLVLAVSAGCAPASPASVERSDAAVMAVAWKRTAAEYEALYHQGFNVARMHVTRALGERRRAGRAQSPLLAVIADLDDTIIDTRDYWREHIADGRDVFDDARWDTWVAKNRASSSPGALEFLTFCRDQGVAVFYITNRDQGAQTPELALAQLKAMGVPFADTDHVTVLRETSNKETRQQEIAKDHEVIVYLGDNLNDFRRRYYVTDVEERRRLMTEDRAEFGARFILFPNPTDGHWIRAIFGDSEPPPTAANRDRLRKAADAR